MPTTRTPRFKPTPGSRRLVVGTSDLAIQLSLYRFGSLTTDQVTRICFGPKSKTYAQDRLTKLFHHGYIDILDQPERMNRPNIYRLTPKGLRCLREQGLVFEQKPRPPMRITARVKHDLIALDLVIALHKAMRVLRWESETELRANPPRANGVSVVWDSWLELTDGTYRYPIAIEVDTGSMGAPEIKAKLKRLMAILPDTYKERFGVDTLVIVWLVPNQSRLAHTLNWIRDSVPTWMQPNFRVSDLDPATTDPQQLVDGRLWHVPGRSELASLKDS